MTPYTIWEKQPAEDFWDEHFLGNGRLGLSVCGGLPLEKITVNDDTLWSGHEQFYVNPDHYEKFKTARNFALHGDVKKANDVINNEMTGRWLEAYMPLGQVWIMQGQGDNHRTMKLKKTIEAHPEQFQDYRRVLDLNQAVETVGWTQDGVHFRRESYVSYPAQAGFVYLTADQPEALQCAFSVDSLLRYTNGSDGEDLFIYGIAPEHAEPSYTPVKPELVYTENSKALRYALRIRVLDTDGDMDNDGRRIYVRRARSVLLAITAKTDYAGFEIPRHGDAKRLVRELGEQLDSFTGYQEAALKSAHIADYQRLYNRMDLTIGDGLTDSLPLSQRLAFCAKGVDDPSLTALLLQYSRYLTIAGSRPGSQPLNLQGIWNDSVSPPWASNYTTNINVEMNYWPCESLNLSECHEPLMQMLKELSTTGVKTAQAYYHMRGWVAHHNVDLWRGSEPSCEDASWSWWPLGAAWMCEHIFTHYEYTLDQDFLRQMYPVLHEAARFLLDFLVEDEEGHLVTAPSISPENKFICKDGLETRKALLGDAAEGRRVDPTLLNISAVTVGSTMDMSLIRELFGNVLKSAEILEIQDEELDEIRYALKHMPPYRIGRYGELLEWKEPYEECEPGMVHTSHMYPVYPASLITEQTSPELFEAARRSMERRTLNAQITDGWPGSWRVCLYARFKNGLECGKLIKSTGGGLGAGLITRNSQQIDAIFGLGAGISEMLLQSHQGYIEILPSPTADWDHGSFEGMVTRGGYVVSAAWKDSRLTDSTIRASRDGFVKVKAKGLKQAVIDGTMVSSGQDLLAFDMKAGQTAELIYADERVKEIFL